MRFLRPALLAIALATPACVADDKGLEDSVPTDGKDDSFTNPTNHGDLAFGVPNNASFTDTEGFHMWTFTLTDAASVDLATTLQSANLDSVMYLYKRTSPTASWGAYIARNDDASDDTSASRLALDLDAAEYRVVVKAYKRTQRGAFSVTGSCTGAGCPTTLACEPAASLPAATGYGGSCGTRLANVYEYASVDAEASTDVALSDRCSLPALERRAVDYYVSYFVDFGGEIDPATMLSVQTRALGGAGDNGGTLIDVGDGGDESSMSLLFDSAGELVLLYQHNQSPDVQFFCKENGVQAVSVPNVEDCVGALVSTVPHSADDEGDATLTAPLSNLPVGLGAEVSLPMQRYAAREALSNFTQITVDGATWDNGFGDKASRLTLVSAGKPKVAYLATSSLVLIESVPGVSGALVCE